MKKGEDYIAVGVTFLCHDGAGNVFLSKRGKNARDEHGRWDPGGGSIEFGDTAEETVRREIKEEYCTEVHEMRFLGHLDVFRKINDKDTHWVSLCYLVHIDREKAGNGEPHKFDAVEWFPFSDLPTPLHSQWGYFLDRFGDQLKVLG